MTTLQVPLMSRNNDTARSVHIGANALTVGLFLWQARLLPVPLPLLCRSARSWTVFRVSFVPPPPCTTALARLPLRRRCSWHCALGRVAHQRCIWPAVCTGRAVVCYPTWGQEQAPKQH